MRDRDIATELIPLISALCGVFFSPIEKPRIISLINRRIKRAYRLSNYWTRFFFVSEQRPVVNGIIASESIGLNPIDTFFRVHLKDAFQFGFKQAAPYVVIQDGARLLSSEANVETVFVTYKMQLPVYYGEGSGMVNAVPDEWFEYIAHGVYSDYLRAEGQQEKASFVEQEADLIIQDELIKLDEQQARKVIV
jgi:hypothetical protein